MFMCHQSVHTHTHTLYMYPQTLPPRSKLCVPDPFLADRSDKVLDMRLCEVLIIVLDQLRVDGWHSHENINHGSLGAQQHLPHLQHNRERERKISITQEGGRRTEISEGEKQSSASNGWGLAKLNYYIQIHPIRAEDGRKSDFFFLYLI